ncbi:transmembrane protein 52 [Candoia aspera]|uniref:transmembrane protein 52 n=1 Tax=Candoia aspera TaxID=51853 RepID=UPI002FD823FB
MCPGGLVRILERSPTGLASLPLEVMASFRPSTLGPLRCVSWILWPSVNPIECGVLNKPWLQVKREQDHNIAGNVGYRMCWAAGLRNTDGSNRGESLARAARSIKAGAQRCGWRSPRRSLSWVVARGSFVTGPAAGERVLRGDGPARLTRVGDKGWRAGPGRAASSPPPMASAQRASPVSCRLVAAAIWWQAVPSFSEIHCPGHQECSQQGTSWTSLWYVWLILITVFLLLMCGIGASCAKFCCRTKRSLRQTFPPHAHDLTVIPTEHDSTAHSTVTSYSSVQYPPRVPLSLPFGDTDRNLACPPAYSLYAIEMPPSYDEAIQMAKSPVETPSMGQKLDSDACEPAASQEQNETQTSPRPSEGSPMQVQENPGGPSVPSQEQSSWSP